jgi:hypothetical protein
MSGLQVSKRETHVVSGSRLERRHYHDPLSLSVANKRPIPSNATSLHPGIASFYYFFSLANLLAFGTAMTPILTAVFPSSWWTTSIQVMYAMAVFFRYGKATAYCE